MKFKALAVLLLSVIAFFSLMATVLAANPTIVNIATVSPKDPTPGSTTAVAIWFVADDADGDLDNTTVAVYFSKTGEATRSDTNCSAAGINETANNYTCSANMQFYDAPGSWTINVTISDLTFNIAYNDTTAFTYNSGLHMSMTPTSISFGTALNVSQSDVAATDDPIVIQNIGNVNVTQVNVTAYDLVGETYSSYTIGSSNFEASATDSANSGVNLSNSAPVTVTGVAIDCGASSTDNVYFFLDVPSTNIQVQDYSTTGGTSWVIAVS